MLSYEVFFDDLVLILSESPVLILISGYCVCISSLFESILLSSFYLLGSSITSSHFIIYSKFIFKSTILIQSIHNMTFFIFKHF